MSKITKDQLKDLNERYSKVQQLKVYVGDAEHQKHILLHQLINADSDLREMQALLEEQYGKVSIDLKDGSYKILNK